MSHTFISSNIYLYQITWTKSSLWFSWLGLLFPPFTSKHKNSQNRLSCNKASLPWIRFLDTMPTQWILCSKWKKLWRKLDKFCGLSPGCHNYQIYDHAHTNTHCLYASFSLCIKQIYYSSENVLFKLWTMYNRSYKYKYYYQNDNNNHLWNDSLSEAFLWNPVHLNTIVCSQKD